MYVFKDVCFRSNQSRYLLSLPSVLLDRQCTCYLPSQDHPWPQTEEQLQRTLECLACLKGRKGWSIIISFYPCAQSNYCYTPFFNKTNQFIVNLSYQYQARTGQSCHSNCVPLPLVPFASCLLCMVWWNFGCWTSGSWKMNLVTSVVMSTGGKHHGPLGCYTLSSANNRIVYLHLRGILFPLSLFSVPKNNINKNI